MANRATFAEPVGMRISPKIVGALAALALAAASFAVSASGATRSETSLTSLNRQVLAGVNAYREQNHLHALRLSAELNRSASQHSFEMGADGYFAHNSASGQAFWQRIQQYYGSAHARYWAVGENLLWASPGVNAEHAMQMWINSPEHRANLLSPRWREIGVSAVRVLSAPGIFHGTRVTIITTDFGVRR